MPEPIVGGVRVKYGKFIACQARGKPLGWGYVLQWAVKLLFLQLRLRFCGFFITSQQRY